MKTGKYAMMIYFKCLNNYKKPKIPPYNQI